MRKGEIQLGAPEVIYTDTQANIEALTVEQGAYAYASDLMMPGWYDGSDWVWGAGGAQAPLFLDGTTDAIQLRVRGHSTQTAHIFQVENSVGYGLARVLSDGRIVLRPEELIFSAGVKYTEDVFSYRSASGGGSVDGDLYSYYRQLNLIIDGATSLIGAHYVGSYIIGYDATNAASAVASTTSLLVTNSIGGGFYGTVTIQRGISVNYGRVSSPGSVTSSFGIRITPSNSGAGAIQNNYALYIDDVTASTLARAITTNVGLVQFGDQVSIVGSSDRIQMIIKANATQTANIVEVTNSTGDTYYLRMNATGQLGIGTAPSVNRKISLVHTSAGSSYESIRVNLNIPGDYIGNAAILGIVSQTESTTQVGVAAPTAIEARAFQSTTRTVPEIHSLLVTGYVVGGGTPTVGSWMGVYVYTPVIESGTLANAYGIYLENISGAGTLNYSIYTQGGLVRFGDQVSIVGSADRIQAIIKANATQTANLLELQKSNNALVAGVDNLGRIFSYGNAAINTNAFYSGAGNETLTGVRNVGFIENTMASLTTGYDNIAIGDRTMQYSTTLLQSVAVGGLTLRHAQTGEDNISVGWGAGAGTVVGGVKTNLIGNVFIGRQAGYTIGNNTQHNVIIGYTAGLSNASHYNVMIGSQAGYSNNGSYNIFIGYGAGFRQTAASNLLIFDQTIRATTAIELTNAILYGEMASTPASQTLRINAVTSIYGGLVGNEDGGTVEDFRWETDLYDGIFLDASNNSVVIMSNAAGKVGFFGATAVVQQTELTDELTTITYTAPGTPDYAVQDLTDSGGFGFATKDEGNTVLSVIANLQTRINELETKLVAYGLLVDVD